MDFYMHTYIYVCACVGIYLKYYIGHVSYAIIYIITICCIVHITYIYSWLYVLAYERDHAFNKML